MRNTIFNHSSFLPPSTIFQGWYCHIPNKLPTCSDITVVLLADFWEPTKNCSAVVQCLSDVSNTSFVLCFLMDKETWIWIVLSWSVYFITSVTVDAHTCFCQRVWKWFSFGVCCKIILTMVGKRYQQNTSTLCVWSALFLLWVPVFKAFVVKLYAFAILVKTLRLSVFQFY